MPTVIPGQISKMVLGFVQGARNFIPFSSFFFSFFYCKHLLHLQLNEVNINGAQRPLCEARGHRPALFPCPASPAGTQGPLGGMGVQEARA